MNATLETSGSTAVQDADRLGSADALGAAASVGGLDPLALMRAIADLTAPENVTAEAARVLAELTEVALGVSSVTIPPADKRFGDPAWQENPAYRRLAQTYLVWLRSLERLAAAPEIQRDWRRAAQARYTSALITAALSPTNFLFGNPAALRRAVDTAGASLVHGAANMLRDVLLNGGMPSQVDARPFTVGENLASTPGAVIYRDEFFELLQYRPSAARVRERPLVMIPPQINKYYFLDLAPGRSLVEYLVSRGLQYFTIAWRNPREEHGHWGLEDYVAAQLRAVDVVREVSGSDAVNTLGVCAGGLTTALMLGHLAAQGDERVSSATFAIAMVDTESPNALRLMADERLRAHLARDAARGKVYDRRDVARNFAWMRPNDLVFNYVSNNWLLGNEPPAFDILAWNSDSTNLVARFDCDMLGIYAANKAATPGSVNVLGTPIDLREVTCDNFIVAGLTDHITPWRACYMTSQLLSGAGQVTITSTGHIQSIVNPPGKPKASYWAGPASGPDPDEWLGRAQRHQGSWWPRYADWLLARSGDERAAPRHLGSRAHPAGDPAPGRYVMER
jgi:polyhydroxyalkanoate synthase subunit PhaC